MLTRRFDYDGRHEMALNSLQLQMKAQVERKLAKGDYRLESTACCICGGFHFEPLAAKDRYGFYYSVVICRNCGLIQTNPRMTESSYGEFYGQEYRKLYGGVETPTHDFFRQQYEHGRIIFDYLRKASAIPAENVADRLVVEVGCGAGGILQYFADQGYRVVGVDLGEQYAAFGRSTFGLDLRVGRLVDLCLNERPCCIVYSHVLEHLLRPADELATVHETLASDGALYIEVPGVKNLMHGYACNFLLYLQTAHTYHFTLATLKMLLEANGFELCSGSEVVQSVFKRSSRVFNGGAPHNSDYSDAIAFLRGIEKEWLRRARRARARAAAVKLTKVVGVHRMARRLCHRLASRCPRPPQDVQS
jgi:2-polyprenyl-3-methyl-5-hydroxy-6-metoxy-1,4-benzoquinol methylase